MSCINVRWWSCFFIFIRFSFAAAERRREESSLQGGTYLDHVFTVVFCFVFSLACFGQVTRFLLFFSFVCVCVRHTLHRPAKTPQSREDGPSFLWIFFLLSLSFSLSLFLEEIWRKCSAAFGVLARCLRIRTIKCCTDRQPFRVPGLLVAGRCEWATGYSYESNGIGSKKTDQVGSGRLLIQSKQRRQQ